MKDVLLLHGALGCNAHWNHILPYLDKSFTYHNLNFPLHGHTASPKKDLQLRDLSDFITGYVSAQRLDEFTIMGYSMGGYAGIDLAIRHQEGLVKVITLGTKLNWSPRVAEEEISRISIEGLKPIHEKLEKEHGNAWRDVVYATHSIMKGIGENPIKKEDMAGITIPVHLLVGEKDKMVTAEETKAFAESGHTITWEVVPMQPHLLERVDAGLIAKRINSLLD